MSKTETSAQHDWTAMRRLAEAATPGPWEVVSPHTDENPGTNPVVASGSERWWHIAEILEGIDGAPEDANAAYIAAANPAAVLALLDQRDAVRAERDEFRKATESAVEAFQHNHDEWLKMKAERDAAVRHLDATYDALGVSCASSAPLAARAAELRAERDRLREALEDIATLRNRSVESICENIAGGLHRDNLSSAIRVYVLAWWRKRARPDAAPSPADKRGTRAPPALFGKFALCHTRPTYNLKEIQPKASPRSRRR